tara:strand:- start:386 stop:1618 length:1233 start_codon:yes stop_codon:yes gene_type:complete
MILNPISGRKVKKSGSIGKKLVNDYKNHKKAGDLKIVKKIDSHPVPSFIQVLKKKISDSLNIAKKIANQFILNPSLKLWNRATKAIFNVFMMAFKFLGKLNIFSKKVKDEHIQKGGGLGNFILKAGKEIILFPFRVIYKIIAEAIRFVRDIMVNCASTFIMILLVLIILDEGLAAYRGTGKGLIRKYAWVGVVKATGADKMEENRGKKSKDIGVAPVAKKVLENSKKSLGSIKWGKLYKNLIYIFSPSTKKSQTAGGSDVKNLLNTSENEDNNQFIKNNIDEIREMNAQLKTLEFEEKKILHSDNNSVLKLKLFAVLFMTIISGFGMYKSEKALKSNKTKTTGGKIALTIVEILSGLGFLFSSTTFFFKLKHMLDEGGYNEEDLKKIRRDIEIKKKQIKDKVNESKIQHQ